MKTVICFYELKKQKAKDVPAQAVTCFTSPQLFVWDYLSNYG